MSTSKQPIDLRAVVQERLDQLTFLKPLRVKAVAHGKCPLIYEEAEGRYSQGARLNESVAIFLDWWGWGRPHNRYSCAVFERANGRWQLVHGRIEDINTAIVSAIRSLAEHALRTSGTEPPDPAGDPAPKKRRRV